MCVKVHKFIYLIFMLESKLLVYFFSSVLVFSVIIVVIASHSVFSLAPVRRVVGFFDKGTFMNIIFF